MLKINRIITDNAFSYPDVEFIDFEHEQRANGIKKYITKPDLNQVIVKTKDGKLHIMPDWMIGVIEVRKMKQPSCSEKVQQITINGEISYGPAYLIEMSEYKRCNVPRIFKYQLSFVSERNLYICHQVALIEIIK